MMYYFKENKWIRESSNLRPCMNQWVCIISNRSNQCMLKFKVHKIHYGWGYHLDFPCRRILRKILCWVYLSVVTSITLLVSSNGCKGKMSAQFARPPLSHLTHNMKYSVLRVWWVKRKENKLFLLNPTTICWQLYREWLGVSLSLPHLLKSYLDWPATRVHLSIYIQRFASS